jgi:hypothetical protein
VGNSLILQHVVIKEELASSRVGQGDEGHQGGEVGAHCQEGSSTLVIKERKIWGPEQRWQRLIGW